jgi:hypothetical protein
LAYRKEGIMGTFDWPYDESDVLAFARAMVHGGYAEYANTTDRCDLLLDLIESPWKWRVELDAWVAAGRPIAFDPTEEAEFKFIETT